MDIPPSLPLKRKPDWAERNWKWLLPVCGLVLIMGMSGLVVIIEALTKSSGAYKDAVARVAADPAVRQSLGSPLHEGYFAMGTVQLINAGGYAHLTIPIDGPKGSGTLFVDATKSAGEWHFDRLVVRIDRTGEVLDLNKR